MISHYDVLQVPSSASMADIKAAYHALALDLHPDKQQKGGQHIGPTIPSDEPEGPPPRTDQAQRFQLVQAAWQVT